MTENKEMIDIMCLIVQKQNVQDSVATILLGSCNSSFLILFSVDFDMRIFLCFFGFIIPSVVFLFLVSEMKFNSTSSLTSISAGAFSFSYRGRDGENCVFT